MQISVSFTRHAQTRLAQRGIRKQHIDLVLKYGQAINRQGFLFYYIPKHILAEQILPSELKYVRNLVVVVSGGASHLVITAYKNEQAVRNIKKKSKHMIGYLVREANLC